MASFFFLSLSSLFALARHRRNPPTQTPSKQGKKSSRIHAKNLPDLDRKSHLFLQPSILLEPAQLRLISVFLSPSHNDGVSNGRNNESQTHKIYQHLNSTLLFCVFFLQCHHTMYFLDSSRFPTIYVKYHFTFVCCKQVHNFFTLQTL